MILILGWVFGWIVERSVYGTLQHLVDTSIKGMIPPGVEYKNAFSNITEAFLFKLKLSLMIGLIPAFPFILLQLWGFIAPGLKRKERQPFKVLVPLSVLLFATGCGFCWVVLPTTLRWFATYIEEFPHTNIYQDPSLMVFFIMKLMLAFGIGFQVPVVVYGLGSLGLLSAETLLKYWRQSTVSIFLISAILTPSNDAFTMLMMAIPLSVLFVISVYAVKFVQRKKRREAEEEDADIE